MVDEKEFTAMISCIEKGGELFHHFVIFKTWKDKETKKAELEASPFTLFLGSCYARIASFDEIKEILRKEDSDKLMFLKDIMYRF